MRYILITDSQVFHGKSLADLEKQSKAAVDNKIFEQIGDTMIGKITDRDLEVLIDAKDFMKIPVHKLFKKESGHLYLLPMYFMLMIVMFQGCAK